MRLKNDKLMVDLYYTAVETKKLSNKIKLYRNYDYRITKISNNMITLMDDISESEFIVNTAEFYKRFTAPYVKTVYGIQGTTIDEKYVIYDTDFYYYDIRCFWVGITRASDINNIFIYRGNKYSTLIK
jgi:hypothetical protein